MSPLSPADKMDTMIKV